MGGALLAILITGAVVGFIFWVVRGGPEEAKPEVGSGAADLSQLSEEAQLIARIPPQGRHELLQAAKRDVRARIVECNGESSEQMAVLHSWWRPLGEYAQWLLARGDQDGFAAMRPLFGFKAILFECVLYGSGWLRPFYSNSFGTGEELESRKGPGNPLTAPFEEVGIGILHEIAAGMPQGYDEDELKVAAMCEYSSLLAALSVPEVVDDAHGEAVLDVCRCTFRVGDRDPAPVAAVLTSWRFLLVSKIPNEPAMVLGEASLHDLDLRVAEVDRFVGKMLGDGFAPSANEVVAAVGNVSEQADLRPLPALLFDSGMWFMPPVGEFIRFMGACQRLSELARKGPIAVLPARASRSASVAPAAALVGGTLPQSAQEQLYGMTIEWPPEAGRMPDRWDVLEGPSR